MHAPPVPRHSWPGCAVWVCMLGFSFRLHPPILAGVFGCVCLLCALCLYPAKSGVGFVVRVLGFAFWLSVRQSWLGCWVVCGCRRAVPVPHHSWLGSVCGCVCLGSGRGCAEPFVASLLKCVCLYARSACTLTFPVGVCRVGVCAWVQVLAAPASPGLGLWCVCLVPGFRFHPANPSLGVGVCVSACALRV